MKFKRGFTLIELLIVIAVIGVLSSVVFSSLNTARSKGNDAKVKAQLSGLRNSAQIYFDTNQHFATVDGSLDCVSTADTLLEDVNIRSYLDNMPAGSTSKCAIPAIGTSYAIATKVSSGVEDYWCIDSGGISRAITITTPGDVTVGDTTCVDLDAR